jgi:hypothetical protein
MEKKPIWQTAVSALKDILGIFAILYAIFYASSSSFRSFIDRMIEPEAQYLALDYTICYKNFIDNKNIDICADSQNQLIELSEKKEFFGKVGIRNFYHILWRDNVIEIQDENGKPLLLSSFQEAKLKVEEKLNRMVHQLVLVHSRQGADTEALPGREITTPPNLNSKVIRLVKVNDCMLVTGVNYTGSFSKETAYPFNVFFKAQKTWC